MSRTATATPPPPYFPQRTSTPTMRHASAPSVTAAHFRQAQPHNSEKRAGRRIKHLPPSLSGLKGRKNGTGAKGANTGLGEEDDGSVGSASGSGINTPTFDLASPPLSPSTEDLPSVYHSTSSSPISASVGSTSFNTPVTTDIAFARQLYPSVQAESHHPRVSVIPSTPSSSPATATTTAVASSPIASTPSAPSTSRSWVPHFALAKITKAVLPSSFSAPWSGVSLGDRKKKHTAAALAIQVDVPVVWEVESRTVGVGEGMFVPEARMGNVPAELVEGLDEDGVRKAKRDWAERQHGKLTECARLCSQWPQSGYNVSKWGPNGAKHSYEPQSYGNPNHVTEIMTRQSALETLLTTTQALYYPSPNHADTPPTQFSARYSSSGSSSTTTTSTTDSYYNDTDDNSAMPSPTTTASEHGHSHNHHFVASELRQAMTSPLLDYGYSAGASLVSLLLPPVERQSLKTAHSLSELNRLAREMMLSKTGAGASGGEGGGGGGGDKMEVDTDTETAPSLASSSTSFGPHPTKPITRPTRAASCGSKRPLPPPVLPGAEEEKRRKVDDEAMVVEDAVETGVIMPPPSSPPPAAVSTNTTHTPAGEVFGHIVKTSDTHPIIISPFFPTDLLPILSTHLVPPPSDTNHRPLFLKSDIDVPALLLAQSSGIVPSPVSSTFFQSPGGSSSSLNLSLNYLGGLGNYLGVLGNGGNGQKPKLGNLLLSSCPGKRLRMGGPVKGRGPVCRDLKTDLGRIKAEGVGCLVCCLDDTELALLGTPWETYRDVANELGLDIIRLPMPDGFAPVSLELFDQQVTLIASRYTLKGTNVLVHCRGGVGRAGVTACAWAIKMGFVQPHPSLVLAEETARRQYALDNIITPPAPTPTAPSKSSGGIIPFFSQNRSSQPTSSSLAPAVPPKSDNSTLAQLEVEIPAELEHQIVMSIVERVVAMIRSRRGLKAIESFEQVQFLKVYVGWLRAGERERRGRV